MDNQLVTRQGSVAGSSRQLVDDMKAVAADAGTLAREVATATKDELASTRASVEASLDEVGVAVSRRAGCAVGAAREYVTQHPWKSMAMGLVAGLLAALLVSRR